MWKKSAFVVLCVVVSAAVAGGIAYATYSPQSPIDANGAIHGCYNPKDGALELNVTGACPTKGDKKAITWNQLSQFFTASGSYIVPTGLKEVTITAIGAGGGGGGSLGVWAGGGGGQGASVSTVVNVTAGATLTINVGEGGTGGPGTNTCSDPTEGSPGGASTVTEGATTLADAPGGGGAGGGVCDNDGTGGSGGIAAAIAGVSTITASSGSAGSNGSGAENCADGPDTGGAGAGIAGVDASGGGGANGSCSGAPYPAGASGINGYVEILPS
jgi:hypothetical protein